MARSVLIPIIGNGARNSQVKDTKSREKSIRRKSLLVVGVLSVSQNIKRWHAEDSMKMAKLDTISRKTEMRLERDHQNYE